MTKFEKRIIEILDGQFYVLNQYLEDMTINLEKIHDLLLDNFNRKRKRKK